MKRTKFGVINELSKAILLVSEVAKIWTQILDFILFFNCHFQEEKIIKYQYKIIISGREDI